MLGCAFSPEHPEVFCGSFASHQSLNKTYFVALNNGQGQTLQLAYDLQTWHPKKSISNGVALPTCSWIRSSVMLIQLLRSSSFFLPCCAIYLTPAHLQRPMGRDSYHYLAKIRVQDVLQDCGKYCQCDWLWTLHDCLQSE